MTPPSHPGLGGRLPLADLASLTGPQRRLYDVLRSTWITYAQDLGVQAETSDGRLIGPFNPFLLHPEVTEKLSDFQIAESSNTTLAPRVREVVVLVVGAVWDAPYELYAQVPVAQGLGFPDGAVAMLCRGEVPDCLSDHERLAARLARALATRHHIDDALYEEAEQAFGTVGLYDIAAVLGEYATVCTMMTLFEVPAPPVPEGGADEPASDTAG